MEQQKKQEEELKKKLEDEAKALEHAKSIVLTEDTSLPVAEKVKKKIDRTDRGDNLFL